MALPVLLVPVLLAGGLLAGPAPPAAAEERAIVLGKADGWRDLAATARLDKVVGRFGDLDLVLAEDEYPPDGETDLLLHFDGPKGEAVPPGGSYRVLSDGSLRSSQVRRLGAASAGFQRGGLILAPGPGALLRRGSRWEDFSLELWVYPLLLGDGEVVLDWKGAAATGAGRTALPQGLQAAFRDRRLQWVFRNLFASPEGRRVPLVALDGLTPLVPREWHHHLIRFDSASGLLEYLVDGVPEAAAQVTTTGGAGGAVCLASVGEAGPSTFAVGESFTGFLDELRLSRRFEGSPTLRTYPSRTGSARSRVLDLGYTGTRVRRIEAQVRTPGHTAVGFHLRLADRYHPEWAGGPAGAPSPPSGPGEGWIPFQPGRELPELRGRWLQLHVELFPDGSGGASPEVADLTVVYEQDLPPVAPEGLRAEAGDGRIALSWKRVNEPDVRGYRIYYGESPGWYHGEGGAEGASPVDVGDATRFTLTGLQNDRLYYFAVVSYDGADPPHLSAFSREVGARPSGLFP